MSDMTITKYPITRTAEDLAEEVSQLREVLRKKETAIESADGAMAEYQKERREYVEEIAKLKASLRSAHELLGIYLK